MNIKGKVLVEHISKKGSVTHTLEFQASNLEESFDNIPLEVKKALEDSLSRIEYPIAEREKKENVILSKANKDLKEQLSVKIDEVKKLNESLKNQRAEKKTIKPKKSK